MGPWLVIVSPCFRENVVATCKIGSFLCSSDNLLQNNLIVLFFGNQISKWCSFEKRAIFDLLFTFSSHQGKVTKIPSAHISNTYILSKCKRVKIHSKKSEIPLCKGVKQRTILFRVKKRVV